MLVLGGWLGARLQSTVWPWQRFSLNFATHSLGCGQCLACPLRAALSANRYLHLIRHLAKQAAQACKFQGATKIVHASALAAH